MAGITDFSSSGSAVWSAVRRSVWLRLDGGSLMAARAASKKLGEEASGELWGALLAARPELLESPGRLQEFVQLLQKCTFPPNTFFFEQVLDGAARCLERAAAERKHMNKEPEWCKLFEGLADLIREPLAASEQVRRVLLLQIPGEEYFVEDAQITLLSMMLRLRGAALKEYSLALLQATKDTVFMNNRPANLALHCLVKMGDAWDLPGSVRSIVEDLGANDPAPRRTALGVLGWLGDVTTTNFVWFCHLRETLSCNCCSGPSDVAVDLGGQPLELAFPHLPDILQHVASDDDEEARYAIEAVGKIGHIAVNPAVALRHYHALEPAARAAAVARLRELAGDVSRLVPPLLAALGRAPIAEAALQALGLLGPHAAAAIVPVARLLRTGPNGRGRFSDLRREYIQGPLAALATLSCEHTRQAVEEFRAWLRSDNIAVVKAGLIALIAMGRCAAVAEDDILELIDRQADHLDDLGEEDDSEFDNRLWCLAGQALRELRSGCKLPADGHARLAHADAAERRAAIDAILGQPAGADGKRVIERVTSGAGGPLTEHAKRALMRGLALPASPYDGNVFAHTSVPYALLQALEDEDKGVRDAALRALGQLPGGTPWAAMAEALGSSEAFENAVHVSMQFKKFCIWTTESQHMLAHIGVLLPRLLCHESEGVRTSAGEFLQMLGGWLHRALMQLCRCLTSANQRARQSSTELTVIVAKTLVDQWADGVGWLLRARSCPGFGAGSTAQALVAYVQGVGTAVLPCTQLLAEAVAAGGPGADAARQVVEGICDALGSQLNSSCARLFQTEGDMTAKPRYPWMTQRYKNVHSDAFGTYLRLLDKLAHVGAKHAELFTDAAASKPRSLAAATKCAKQVVAAFSKAWGPAVTSLQDPCIEKRLRGIEAADLLGRLAFPEPEAGKAAGGQRPSTASKLGAGLGLPKGAQQRGKSPRGGGSKPALSPRGSHPNVADGVPEEPLVQELCGSSAEARGIVDALRSLQDSKGPDARDRLAAHRALERLQRRAAASGAAAAAGDEDSEEAHHGRRAKSPRPTTR